MASGTWQHQLALTILASWFIAETRLDWMQRFERDPALLDQYELDVLPLLSVSNVQEDLKVWKHSELGQLILEGNAPEINGFDPSPDELRVLQRLLAEGLMKSARSFSALFWQGNRGCSDYEEIYQHPSSPFQGGGHSLFDRHHPTSEMGKRPG